MYNLNPPKNKQISNIENVTPFKPIVVKAHYPNWNWKKIETICESLIKNTNSKVFLEQGDAGSTINGRKVPHLMPEFKEFYDWLNPIALDVIINKFEYHKDMDYVIYNSWINYHNFGGETIAHHHGPSILAVSSYLHLPENGGYIEFKDPMEYNNTFYPAQINDEISNWKVVPAESGDVLMFPGWLRHRTQKNNSNIKRWVLTTNYICTNFPKRKFIK
jgi:uncharacterized protein (TIGR02466 family)